MDYENPAQRNTEIMMAFNVLNTRAVLMLSKKKETMHTSYSIHNLYKCVQKLTSFYFTYNIITELEHKYCFNYQHRK